MIQKLRQQQPKTNRNYNNIKSKTTIAITSTATKEQMDKKGTKRKRTDILFRA